MGQIWEYSVFEEWCAVSQNFIGIAMVYKFSPLSRQEHFEGNTCTTRPQYCPIAARQVTISP